MKRLLTLGTMAVLLLLALSACADAALAPEQFVAAEPAFAPDVGGFADEAEGMVFEEAARVAPESAGDFAAPGELANQEIQQERLVIQDGNMTIIVTDPAQSIESIAAMAQRMGGFVVSSNLFSQSFGEAENLADSGAITVRVPADRFDDAREEIKNGAVEVNNEFVSGQDVTQEYTDLQSRLRNLEATEAVMLEILETADSTEDALLVLNDLRFIREEIEIIKGRIQFLEQSALLSAISVEVLPDVASQPIQPNRWTPGETFKNALEALVNTLQLLVDVVIWLAIYALPVLLLIFGIPIIVLFVLVRRRRGKKNDKKDEA